MHSVIFVPGHEAWQRAGTPGGLSLLERQLKQLERLGVKPPLLLVPDGDPSPAVAVSPKPLAVRRVPSGTRDLGDALIAASEDLPETCIVLTADRLVDPRVLRALAEGREPSSVFARVDPSTPEPVGRISVAELRREGRGLMARARSLPLATLDPYVAELRGEAEPYVLAVRTADERRAAWRALLDHVQKRTLDLPGQYFDSPFENLLVRRLAPTDVTPNQVTLATLVVAGIVGMLFLRGWLRTGVALALVVGVLDGVDGKLARLKLATSRLGELEHVADFFYENFWYLALASYLAAATGSAALRWVGGALVALDLSDSLLYFLLRRRTGVMLDELTPFDRRFRRVAGRRNVYVWILIPGFFGGHPVVAFVAATLWAAVTVCTHGVRVATVLGYRRTSGAAGIGSGSATEGAVPRLVNEK